MHRSLAAAALVAAVLVLGAPRAGAQAPPTCAPTDLSCALTVGIDHLATSLGVTTTTTPAARPTATTVRHATPGALGTVSSSSAGAVVAATGADALEAVSPPAPNSAVLALPPLAMPDFGSPPVLVAPRALVAPPAGSAPARPHPARPLDARPTSDAAWALGACLVVAVALVLGGLGVRRLPTGTVVVAPWRPVRAVAARRRLRVVSPGG